jgi:hypothetical protein
MPQRMTRDLRVGRYEGSYYDLGDCAGEVTVFWERAAIQRVRATSNLLINFQNTVAGRRLVLVLEQDATGGRTVTAWPWYVRWQGGTAPELSTDPGSVDLIEFLCTSVVRVYGRLWGLSFQSST